MAVTPEQLAAIRRELDRDLEARLSRPRHEPQPREPEQTAAQRKKLHDDAWNAWANALIDAKLRDFVNWANLKEYTKGVGDALARVRADIRKEISEEIREKVTGNEKLWAGVSDAMKDFVEAKLEPLRTELSEVKTKLAEAEARLASVTEEHKAAPLALPAPGWVGRA